MLSRILAGLALALAWSTPALQAQNRWGFELRGGVALATEDPANTSLDAGFGFEGTVAYRFQPHLSMYTGWDWHRFAGEGTLAGADAEFEETGYALGLLFEHPVGSSDVLAVQLRGGATYNHIEVENDAGGLIADSGHGVGYEAGAGLAIRVSDFWRATPGVRFRSLSRGLEIGAATADVDLRYVALELGFAGRF